MPKDKLIYASAARKAILDADPRLAYCIDEIPGVDAVKVVHGQWKLELLPGVWVRNTCSVCGWSLDVDPDHSPLGCTYCPNCGAKMDGD